MEKITFITNILSFYLKGEISCNDNFVKLKKPNTVLLLIPFGAENESIPINHISAVSTNFKLDLRMMLYCILALMISFAFAKNMPMFSILLMLLSVSGIISSFKTVLTIQTTSGNPKKVSFIIFEKEKAENVSSTINKLISEQNNP